MIVIDIGVPFRLDSDKLKSKSNNSPFDEKTLQGKVLRTFVGGRNVYAAD